MYGYIIIDLADLNSNDYIIHLIDNDGLDGIETTLRKQFGYIL